MQELPFSPACERNKDPIATILKPNLKDKELRFLELGFGTLQHALHLCQEFPTLEYFACDQENYHPIFDAYRERGMLPNNLKGPFLFKATESETLIAAEDTFNIIFSANTLHIMGWSEALSLLNEVPTRLSPEGHLFIYGPFKFDGAFTSDSNQNFDGMLKERDPKSGIRDFEAVKSTLESNGLTHLKTVDMPANNHILHFMRKK